MLWDIIRDWFVMYIFGGYTSTEVAYSGTVGFAWGTWFANPGDIESYGTNLYSNSFLLPVNFATDDAFHIQYLSIGDWLSTTSTIIVLILMCIFLFICVRYLFKVGAGLFSNLRG